MSIPVPPPAGAAIPLRQKFDRLHRASRAEPFPELEERRARLSALTRLLLDHKDEWTQAIAADFGHRSAVETELLELFPAIAGVRYAQRRLARWMRTRRRGVSLWFRPARAEVRPQPLGVVGIVVPWNYPLFLALGPLTAALAAGNRVMVKMSEYTPQCGALFARLARRYFGSEMVCVVNGDAELAKAFCALPFDHLLFTGSGAVGRQVMQAAAANLTPVTLELGGKSPVLVAPGFDSGRAAQRIAVGKLLNAGQTCVAPDYVLVHEAERVALVEALRHWAGKLYPTLAGNPDYSWIANERHLQRLQRLLDEAKAGGALVLTLNPAGETFVGSRVFPPTLVLDAPADCALMREEIFGPILPIVSYRSVDEALAYINARPRPLALYLFDSDARRIDRVLAGTLAGGVCVNDTVLHVGQHELPFGGVGASGMGHYHGPEGFATFSKLLPVFRQPRCNFMWMVLPPYGRRVRWLIERMLGRADRPSARSAVAVSSAQPQEGRQA